MKKQFLALACLFPLLFVNLYASCPTGAYYQARYGSGTPMRILGYLRDGVGYLIIVAAIVMLILAIRDFVKIRKSESFTPEAQKRISRKYLQICFGAIGAVLLSVLLSVVCAVISATSERGDWALYALTPTWIHSSLVIVLEGFALSVLSCIVYLGIKRIMEGKYNDSE